MASSPSKAASRQSTKVGSKRTSPTPGSKGSKLTPVGSLVRKVQAKLRSNIQSSSEVIKCFRSQCLPLCQRPCLFSRTLLALRAQRPVDRN